MTRIASLAVCVFVPVLLLISRTALAPHGGVQHPTPPDLKEEIERVKAEIDRIFAETLAQHSAVTSTACRNSILLALV